MTINPNDFTSTNIWLGRSNYGGDPYFDGKLDEVNIYAKELSAAEVATLATP